MSRAEASKVATTRVVRPLSLRRNFSWTMLGNVFYAACQWAILALLAKLGNTQIVGEFALALAIAGPVMIFANLKLRAVQASDAKNEYSFGEYLGLRLSTTPVALLVIASIVAINYRSDVGIVILLIGLAKSFETISDIMFGLFQQQEQMKRIAISQILKGTLSIIVFGITVWLTGSLKYAVAGLAASWAFVLVCYDIPIAAGILNGSPVNFTMHVLRNFRRLDPNWDRTRLLLLAQTTLPLGLTVLLGALGDSIPRYFIAGVLGTKELGLFAGMSYVLVSGSLVIGALAQSATPRLSQHFAAKQYEAFMSLLFKMVAVGALLGILGVAVTMISGSIILRFLYSEEYARHNDVFIWIMVDAGVGYAYVFLGTACSSMRKFAIQLPIHIISVTVLVVLSWYLIGDHGIKGAAWALLGSGIVEAAAYAFVITRELRRVRADSIIREE